MVTKNKTTHTQMEVLSMISFGTGGWRAIIGDEFTKTNVQRLTYALAQWMKKEDVQDKSFDIGYDRRFFKPRGSPVGGGGHGRGRHPYADD